MNSIGKVVSVTYDRLIFEVSDFERLNYNFKGQIYIAKGIIDYVTIKNRFDEKFIYQVIKVSDRELILSADESAKFSYSGNFECVPIGMIKNNNNIEFNLTKYPFLQDKVYLTTIEEFNIIFNSEEHENSISLGLIEGTHIAKISPNKLLTHHSAIIGNTGSGKSNTVRKIISEINNKEMTNLKLHVFDVHDEYSQLDNIKVINVLEEYRINLLNLDHQDWLNLVKPSELVQLPVVETALKIANCIQNNMISELWLKCFIAYNLYNNQQTDAVTKRAKIIGILNDTEIDTSKYNSQFGNFSATDEKIFLSDLLKVLNGNEKYSYLNKYIEKAEYKVSSFENLLIALNYVFLLEECKGNSQAKESEGTKAEESTTAKSEEKDMVSTAAAEESTEGAQEELSYDSGAVNKSNIFASYPGDAMWKSTANEYMLIPYIKDGKELIEFRLYGEARFLLEGLSFSKTEQNGLKVSGKMRNLKDNSWNGDADVTWNSLETIDYPIVTLTNGTEFTDVDMGGDYNYAGLVNSVGQSNIGTATNTSEYIFPYANERLITRGEYESLDAATLRF